MSQAKVDRYKEEKANRKEIMKKAKRKALVMKIAGAVFGLAVLGVLANSVKVQFVDKAERPSVTVDYTAMEDYLETLNAEEKAE